MPRKPDNSFTMVILKMEKDTVMAHMYPKVLDLSTKGIGNTGRDTEKVN